jgi:hypothetical protein
VYAAEGRGYGMTPEEGMQEMIDGGAGTLVRQVEWTG